MVLQAGPVLAKSQARSVQLFLALRSGNAFFSDFYVTKPDLQGLMDVVPRGRHPSRDFPPPARTTTESCRRRKIVCTRSER